LAAREREGARELDAGPCEELRLRALALLVDERLEPRRGGVGPSALELALREVDGRARRARREGELRDETGERRRVGLALLLEVACVVVEAEVERPPRG